MTAHVLVGGARHRILLVGALLVVLAAASTGVVETFSGSRPATHPAKSPAGSAGAESTEHGGQGHAVAPTFLGSSGVESRAVIAENRLPGTTAWQITAEPTSGYIEGFADTTYASMGDQVGLYVSTSAPQFRVVAFRMGYYQGKGAREIWSSGEIQGQVQPGCSVTAGVNMVTCDDWARSLDVRITDAFTPGDYLFKLLSSNGNQSYVLLTVWDPANTATYLVLNRSLTEEGWNTYGGYSFYQGEGPCTLDSNSYPVCNRARVVSFDRPYAEGYGASDFLSNEYPLVRYMEEQGLDVAYATDVMLDEHPAMLLQHRALLSLGHDEIWTYTEREAAQSALEHGVNVAFFGAAAVLRHARLQSSPLGADRDVVDYRNESEDPLNGQGDPMNVTGNTWSSPPASWPESGFTGEIYSGYLEPGYSAAFVVEDPSAWIFKGTGLVSGSSVPGVVESDIDHVDPTEPMPTDLEVLGHSPVPLADVYTNQGSWSGFTYSDMTYYTDPSNGGGVFDSGTVNWINALTPCTGGTQPCAATTVGRITGNLLWLFGQGPAGDLVPSVSNTQVVVPPGS